MVPITWYDDVPSVRPGRLGTSGCPGTFRGLDADLASLREARVESVFCLLEDRDFRAWGVPKLLREYDRGGLRVHRHPIRDFSVPTLDEMARAVDELEAALREGRTALIHCAAGIGRTGTPHRLLAGAPRALPRTAIHTVRAHRPGSLENWDQETFVHDFAALEASAR
ncbi:MAG: dual specificity protein phosphatase family protein [Deltaproteobacteria bacterium]|nr:dual specificity protein phosphatase family protein [Deltaproteobacteria bacterium]